MFLFERSWKTSADVRTLIRPKGESYFPFVILFFFFPQWSNIWNDTFSLTRMHLELASHSARSGLMTPEMVKRALQLRQLWLFLSQSTCLPVISTTASFLRHAPGEFWCGRDLWGQCYPMSWLHCEGVLWSVYEKSSRNFQRCTCWLLSAYHPSAKHSIEIRASQEKT